MQGELEKGPCWDARRAGFVSRGEGAQGDACASEVETFHVAVSRELRTVGRGSIPSVRMDSGLQWAAQRECVPVWSSPGPELEEPSGPLTCRQGCPVEREVLECFGDNAEL